MASLTQQPATSEPGDLEDITLWSHPLATLTTLLEVLRDWLAQGLQLLARHLLPVALLLLAVLLPHLFDGPHSPVVAPHPGRPQA